MKTIIKTATEARNDFFNLILAAKYGNQITIVTKNGQPAAHIQPPHNTKRKNWGKIKAALKAAGGIFTDEDVRQIRQMRIDSRKSKYPDW